MTTVKQLREMLKDVPDDAIVVVVAPDHEYRMADVSALTALTRISGDPTRGGEWMYEDYGDDNKLDDDDYRIPVLLVY